MSKELPWFRFFPSDWLAGTRGMSASQTGIYITLIATMYDHGKPVAEDYPRLARLCGAGSVKVFCDNLAALVDAGKIIRTAHGLWNERVAAEVLARMKKSDVGSQSAKTRWGVKTKQKQEPADANASKTHGVRNANQNPESEIEKELPDGSSKKKAETGKFATRIPEDFQPDVGFALDNGFSIRDANREADHFRDYWHAKPGRDGTKLDWPATWRNWIRNSRHRPSATGPPNGHRPRNFVDAARDLWMAEHGTESTYSDHGNAERLPAGEDGPGRDDGDVFSGAAHLSGQRDH